MTEQRRTRIWVVLGALALIAFAVTAVRAQQEPQQSPKPPLKGGVTYNDQSSENCEKQNENNPYTGMDPLTCYGVMAPADSRGQCSLGGMQVRKQEGNTCYYCQPINPPIQGIIIPLDDLAAADAQGFRCGVDQADACMAVCEGNGSFNPPPGTVEEGGGPGTPQPPSGEPGPIPPRNSAPRSPLPGQNSAGGNPCLPFGSGGYNYCDNPAGTQPAGCVCGTAQPAPSQPASTQPVLNFGNYLLADAQTMLQNAGRVSKAMTDAMDVTKHNNVGIGVAFGAAFGASGKMMGFVAQEYQALAAAGAAASQESTILEIASDAASESGTVANQATETASELESTGGTAIGAAPNAAGYLEGAVYEPAASQPAIQQGALPDCTVLSCNRLAQLLGRNIPLERVIENIKPNLKMVVDPKTGAVSMKGGLTLTEVQTALKSIGVNAQVGTGMTPMMNQVRAGNPVIAFVYTTAATDAPLHAVVIEGVETQGGVSGLVIYDPLGSVDWQPIQTFQKYFTNGFVKPL